MRYIRKRGVRACIEAGLSCLLPLLFFPIPNEVSVSSFSFLPLPPLFLSLSPAVASLVLWFPSLLAFDQTMPVWTLLLFTLTQRSESLRRKEIVVDTHGLLY